MIPTYVINLDRAKARLERVMKQLMSESAFHIHRIPGVDGKYEDFSNISLDTTQTMKYFGQPLSKGTVGCYLSHVNAWQTFVNSKEPYGLILEDDVVLDAPVLWRLIQDLCKIQNGMWDICSFQLNHRGMPLRVMSLGGYRMCTYLACVTGAGAYLLTAKGANLLLRQAFPIVFPVDHYYTKSHRLGTRFIGIEPRPVTQAEGTSFIDEIGRERLRTLSLWQRVRCGTRRIWEEAQQGFYNARWGYFFYRW